LSDEWRVKQAADLEAKAAELTALTGERERQRAQLEAYQARYDRDVAELAEQEVRQEVLLRSGGGLPVRAVQLGHRRQSTKRAGIDRCRDECFVITPETANRQQYACCVSTAAHAGHGVAGRGQRRTQSAD
jgi:hypothetical protein